MTRFRLWRRQVFHAWWVTGRTIRYALPRRVRIALYIILSLQIIGTIGYPLIEGRDWSWFDGAYMTAITLATIGYGEVHPLSDSGRAFTMVLAYGGIFTLAYFASEVIRTVVNGELRELIGRERMEQDLAKLRGHLIVCGHGRMGAIVSEELDRLGQAFVVIDMEPPTAGEWPYKYGLRLQGDATEDDVLRRAGAERAKALIATVGSDAQNLYVTLSARLINPKLVIVARAEEHPAEAKLRKVGATHVISPYISGGQRAVQAVLRPAAMRVMDMATRPEFQDLCLEEFPIEPGARLAGVSLRDSQLGRDYEVTVIGVVRPNGEMLFSPPGDTVIEAGATLIVLGRQERLNRVKALAAVDAED